jgi:hypothetical protein
MIRVIFQAKVVVMNMDLQQTLFEQKFNLCQLAKAGFVADYIKPIEEEILNRKLKCPYKKGLLTTRYKNVEWHKFIGHRFPAVLYTFLPMISPTHPPEWITFYFNVSGCEV